MYTHVECTQDRYSPLVFPNACSVGAHRSKVGHSGLEIMRKVTITAAYHKSARYWWGVVNKVINGSWRHQMAALNGWCISLHRAELWAHFAVQCIDESPSHNLHVHSAEIFYVPMSINFWSRYIGNISVVAKVWWFQLSGRAYPMVSRIWLAYPTASRIWLVWCMRWLALR